MQVSVEDAGRWLRIAVKGRLDTVTAWDFDQRMASLTFGIQQGVLLDLAGMEYISSAGIRSFVALLKKVKECGGSMAACGVARLPKEVLTLTRVDELIPLFETADEAFQHLCREGGEESGTRQGG